MHWLRKALRALPCKPLASACWEQFNEIARLFRTCRRRLSSGRRRIRGIAPVGTRRLPTDPDARARRDLVGRLSESRSAGQQGQDFDDRKDSTDFHFSVPSPIRFHLGGDAVRLFRDDRAQGPIIQPAALAANPPCAPSQLGVLGRYLTSFPPFRTLPRHKSSGRLPGTSNKKHKAESLVIVRRTFGICHHKSKDRA